jgi:hypothetical protein
MKLSLFKTLTVIVCGVFFMSAVRAQDTNAIRTEMDAFESATGVVIVRASLDMGALTVTAGGTVSVKCKESVETTSGRKQHALEVTLIGKDSKADTTLIDYDELDALLNGLDYLSRANWSLTSLPSFDAMYSTRDGLQAAAYSSQKRPGTIGASLKSNRTVRVRISLTTDEFSVFRGMIQQAKVKLDALHGVK